MKVDRPSGKWKLWYLLLLVPFIGTLFPSFYASLDPKLWGFPFFYWYQMLWVVLSAVITFVVYQITRKREA